MNVVLASHSERTYIQPYRSQSKPIGKYKPTGKGYIHSFHAVYSRWKSETRFESNPKNIISHTSFEVMVRMAREIPEIVSIIIQELRLEPSMLVWVLDKALGDSPYSAEDFGDIRKMSEAWVHRAE